MATELNLSSEVRAHFRDDLRRARLATLRDAEDFHDIIYCVERLGVALTGTLGALVAYQERLTELAATFALSTEIPARAWVLNRPRPEGDATKPLDPKPGSTPENIYFPS